MDFDLSSLQVVFDELLPLTDEEQKIYWFKFTRPDSITITLVFSVYEGDVNVIVRCNPEVACASIKITQCTAVRVLEIEKKSLEVISGNADSLSKRCFISLLGDAIVEFEDNSRAKKNLIEKIPKNRSRLSMLPSAIAPHLTRLVLIALELQHQGAEVAFAFPENNQILQHYNFQFFPVADAVVTDFSSNVFDAYTPSLIEQCVKDELKAIEAFKPDAIIGDFRLTAAISSKIAKIPYISVVNGYMTDYFDPVDVMIPKQTRPVEHKIASIAARAIQRSQKRTLATHVREIAQKHKPKKLVSLYDFLTGDLTLIAG